MKEMKWFLIVGVLCIFILSCAAPENEAALDAEAAESTIPVEITIASSSDFGIPGEYYGQVEPSLAAEIIVSGGGRVDALSAVEGDWVSAGQSLGRIDADRMEKKFELALHGESLARDTYLRQQELHEKGSVSKLALDQSKLNWLSAKSNLLDSRKLLDGALSISPIDGIVLNRHVELFDELAPGMPSFSLGNIDTLIARIAIPESEIAGIEEGSQVEVSFSSYPDTVLRGTLTRLSRIPEQGSISFEGIVSFENPDRKILPGVTSKITLVRQYFEEVITLPLEAILTAGNDSFAMLEENGIAVRRELTLGAGDGETVVVEEGIIVGDRVILGGNHVVSTGKAVSSQLR